MATMSGGLPIPRSQSRSLDPLSSSQVPTYSTPPERGTPRPRPKPSPNPHSDKMSRQTSLRGRQRIGVKTDNSSNKIRLVEIEIPLSSRPHYIPGSAPPSAPITLLPVHDSTAYIIDTIVLPRKEDMEENSRRNLYYIIGWDDLPAARATILATKVLDYVSPRMLEDWNYKDLLRREEEKAIAEAKKKSKTKQPRRPGRPPRSQRDQETPVPELSQKDQELIARKKAAGPSLSTPQKRVYQQLLDEETGAEDTGAEQESDDVAIARQLYGESDGREDIADDRSEDDEEQLDETPDDVTMMSVDDEDVEPTPKALPQQRTITPIFPPKHMQHPAYASTLSQSKKTPLKSTLKPKPTPRAKKPADPGAKEPANGKLVTTNDAQPPKPAWKVAASAAATTNATTNPGMIHPMFAKVIHEHIIRNSMSPSSDPLEPTPEDDGLIPSSASIHPAFIMARDSGEPSFHSGFTPVTATRDNPRPRISTSHIPIPVHPLLASQLAANASSVKPGGKNKQKTQQPKEKQKQPKEKKETKPKKEVKIVEIEDDEEEPAWEVKRLLSDGDDYDEKGNLVHLYQVLWEGDWPPGQNPTWEPEDNISPKLIEEYKKKKEKKAEAAAKKRAAASGRGVAKPAKTPKVLPKKRYSNVAEAFEGDLLELEGAGGAEVHPDFRNQVAFDVDEDEGEEQLFVTEDHKMAAAAARNGNGQHGNGNGTMGKWGGLGSWEDEVAKYRDRYGN